MLDTLKLYQHLPHPFRVLVTSAWGYYLRFWRYGPMTEDLVNEALERETWTKEKWRAWQEERLAFVLHRAATKVPYYRDAWNNRRRHGDQASYEYLENWPILKKEDVIKNPLAFVSEDCNIRWMFRERTSGTTGTPLLIYYRRDTLIALYALFEARTRRWYGVSLKQRWAILGGQLIVPFQQKKPPFGVHNLGLNQLYLSTHHLSPINAKWYVDSLKYYEPTHMIVYPSSASILATEILKQSLSVPRLKVIFSNAELLLTNHRENICKAFQCPVRDIYGMSEIVAGASECERSSMHIWPEVGIIEIFHDTKDVLVKNAESGRLILTGLLNVDMPLIRYEIGDRGKFVGHDNKCVCGRNIPQMPIIEGRLNDLIFTPDGRKIFWLNPIFYGLPIREAQIIQESLNHIRVRFVPSTGYSEKDDSTIIRRLRDRVGDMEIALEQVEFIPRSSSGKFKAVVSYV